MSEIDALLGLYGAVDRAVDGGAAKASDLAPLLSAYREDAPGGPATGWYEHQYLPWLDELKNNAARREGLARGRDLAGPPVPPAPEDAEPGEPPTRLRDLRPSDVKLSDVRRLRDVRRGRGRDPERGEKEDVDPAELIDGVRQALAGFGTIPLEGRAAARRLLAVAVAARALPEQFGRAGSETDLQLARDALTFEAPQHDPGFGGARTAEDLHFRVVDDFTSMGAWSEVVGNAVRDKVLPEDFALQESVVPCTGNLILWTDEGTEDADPCLVMESEFITKKITFASAKKYLAPENWHYPGSLWCRMEKVEPQLGKHTWLYHETVATSCPPETASWSVSTDLQFWFSHPSSYEARVEYDFPAGGPAPFSDIEVDEGSLQIFDLGANGVHVKTTKRVRFAGSMDGAGLAMFMCATGYSSILEDMVYKVATTAASALQPFPVQAPPGGAMPDNTSGQTGTNTGANAKTGQAKTGQAKAQQTSTGEDSLEAISKDAATYVGDYLETASAAATKSVNAIRQGTYKVEDAWADGIKLWSDYLANLTKAVELGTRTAKVYAKKPLDEN